MIYEEFYIDGKEVDIKDVQIVRTYTSPYFKSFDDTSQDTTLTITLPPTEKNKAVMMYLSEHDSNTTFPYRKHTAEYIIDGFPLFSNGVVHVLAPFEIQVVYGINRETYIKLKEFKLNEIVADEINILSSQWVVDWNRGNGINDGMNGTKMFAPYKAYKYINYIKGERKSDYEIVNGVSQPKVGLPDKFKDDANEMSWHPFILATTILGLIRSKAELSTEYNEFSTLYARLANKGLILTGNEDDQVVDLSVINSEGYNFNESKLYLNAQIYNGVINKNEYSLVPRVDLMPTMDGEIEFDIKIKISDVVDGLYLEGRWFDEDGVLQKEKIQDISYLSVSGGYIFYNTKVAFKIDATSYKYNAGLFIRLLRGYPEVLDVIYSIVPYSGTERSRVNVKYTNKKSTYCLSDPNNNNATYGRYNCLKNLPKITGLEFLQAMCAHVCGFIGNDFKIYYLDEFKANLTTGNVYDWTGKISNIVDSEYKFNSLEQKNYIKFNNDKDFIDRKYKIEVDDETLDAEKDLVTLPFDTPLGDIDKQSEVILYEQEVKGKNNVNQDDLGNKVYYQVMKPPYNVNDLWVQDNASRTGGKKVWRCINAKAEGSIYLFSDFEEYPYKVNWYYYPETPYILGELFIRNSVVRICTNARASGAYVASDFELYQYNMSQVTDILYKPPFPYNKGDILITLDLATGRKPQYKANVTRTDADLALQSDWDLVSDGEVKTFTSEPIAPYYVNDIWIDGDKVYVCTEDQFDEFDQDDWDLKIDSLQDYISDISSDGILSPQEKKGLRLEWETCLAEKTRLATESINFGVTTEYDNYNQAFTDLSTYLNAATWTSGVPLWLSDAQIDKNTPITATTFRYNWKNFYDKKTILKNKLTQIAKEYDPFFIGGYNFIKNSNLAKGLVDGWVLENANSNEIIYTGLPTGATHGYKFKPISGYGGIWYQRSALKIVAGKKYTLSFYVKSDTNCNIEFGDEGSTRLLFAVTSTWQRAILTFTASASSNFSFYSNSGSAYTYVTNFQLEAGSNVSDWNNNPDTKLSAFDYLAEAMNPDFGVESLGGLLLAKVIQMRDSNGVVRAGLSGLETDPLLLWGGGNYQKALDGLVNVVIKKSGEFFLGGEQNRRKVEVTMENLDTLSNYINQTSTIIQITDTSPKTVEQTYPNPSSYVATSRIYEDNSSVPFTLTADALISIDVAATAYQVNIATTIYAQRWVRIVKITYPSGVKTRTTIITDENSSLGTSRLRGSYYLPAGEYVIDAYASCAVDTGATNPNGSKIGATINWQNLKYSYLPSKTVLAANGFGCVRDAYNYFYLSQSISNDFFLQGRGNMEWLSEDGTKGLRVTNEGVQKYNGSTWVTL